jgi:hypothetical protein
MPAQLTIVLPAVTVDAFARRQDEMRLEPQKENPKGILQPVQAHIHSFVHSAIMS